MQSRHIFQSLPTTLSPRGTSTLPQEPDFVFRNTSGDLYSDVPSPQVIQEAFDLFKKRIDELETEFGDFSRECRQLGRSYALISAVRALREKLDVMLSVFKENMDELSQLLQDTQSIRSEPVAGFSYTTRTSASFEQVAKAFETFRERLHEFRDHTDESLKFKSLIKLFERDLKVCDHDQLFKMLLICLMCVCINNQYRASCLEAYEDHYNPVNMRLFIHGLTQEVRNDLDEIFSALKTFNTYGLPAMQYEQKRDSEGVLNMSTVATFFSAVTATTLQMSVGIQGETLPSPVIAIVNTFWFCSLVLSIGAALNSLMAAAWKSTTYGTRGRRLPIWVTIWIHASAPIFLVLSIACFSAGLVLFSYGSQQAKTTSIFTLISTVVTFFGFITVASWILYEQWIAPYLTLPEILWLQKKAKEQSSSQKADLTVGTKLGRPLPRRTRSDSISEHSNASTESGDSLFNITTLLSGLKSLAHTELPHPPVDLEAQTAHIESGLEQPESQGAIRKTSWMTAARAITFEALATKKFWRETVLTVPRMSVPTRPNSGHRTSSSATYVPPLPEMYRAFPTGFGAVQDLEFSPNGKLLATANYDEHNSQSRTVCYITETYQHTFRFKHTPGGAVKQITWSADGARILARLDHSLDILDSQCKPVSSIKRPHQIESAAWCDANNNEILSVERNIVFKMSLEGNVLSQYRFKNILLRDVAVVPGGRLLLAVGRVTFPHEENLPSNSRGEKQLILYDMETRKYLSRNPLLDDVRHVTLAKKLTIESTSYEVLLGHKNKPPPQLWTLSPHLIGPHQLQPKSVHMQLSGDLVGSGYFAGAREEMILCVDHEGSVHIRDRERDIAVHTVQAQTVPNNWRRVAYCPTLDPGSIVFATVDAAGFKIWTVALPAEKSSSSETLRLSTSSPSSTARPATILEEQPPTGSLSDEPERLLGTRPTSV